MYNRESEICNKIRRDKEECDKTELKPNLSTTVK